MSSGLARLSFAVLHSAEQRLRRLIVVIMLPCGIDKACVRSVIYHSYNINLTLAKHLCRACARSLIQLSNKLLNFVTGFSLVPYLPASLSCFAVLALKLYAAYCRLVPAPLWLLCVRVCGCARQVQDLSAFC